MSLSFFNNCDNYQARIKNFGAIFQGAYLCQSVPEQSILTIMALWVTTRGNPYNLFLPRFFW